MKIYKINYSAKSSDGSEDDYKDLVSANTFEDSIIVLDKDIERHNKKHASEWDDILNREIKSIELMGDYIKK